MGEARCYIVGFEDGRRGYEPVTAKQAAVEAGKDKERDPPQDSMALTKGN